MVPLGSLKIDKVQPKLVDLAFSKAKGHPLAKSVQTGYNKYGQWVWGCVREKV